MRYKSCRHLAAVCTVSVLSLTAPLSTGAADILSSSTAAAADITSQTDSAPPSGTNSTGGLSDADVTPTSAATPTEAPVTPSPTSFAAPSTPVVPVVQPGGTLTVTQDHDAVGTDGTNVLHLTYAADTVQTLQGLRLRIVLPEGTKAIRLHAGKWGAYAGQLKVMTVARGDGDDKARFAGGVGQDQDIAIPNTDGREAGTILIQTEDGSNVPLQTVSGLSLETESDVTKDAGTVKTQWTLEGEAQTAGLWTQIASAVRTDDLICLTTPAIGQLSVGYPREVFTDSEEDQNSKQFVQRFLDATRADMFFASKMIFVEGVAEELLLPVFAKYLGYDLTDAHVLVVNMGGRYFSHFLKLFDTTKPKTINKRVACITDIDPVEKENGADDYEACYPYEYGVNADSQYRHHGDAEMAKYATHPNIRFFRQDATYGRTLEYDLMRENAGCADLLTESVKNKNELRRLMAEQNIDAMLDNILRKSDENRHIAAAIRACGWADDEKRKAIIASRYLNSVSKGANALELNVTLEANLEKAPADRFEFHVPQYIEQALRWLLS